MRGQYAILYGTSITNCHKTWRWHFALTGKIRVVNLRGPERKGNAMSRIDLLRCAANDTGFTIDYLEALTAGLSRNAALKVIGNASSMPSYMKSSDNPYVFRNAIAPSIDTRCSPVSQLDS